MGLMNKLGYTGILLTGLAGCDYDAHQPIGKPGLERRVSVQAEEKRTETGIPPQVSYEKAVEFFEPEMNKIKIPHEEIEDFRERLKEDGKLRNLLYAVYSDTKKFEEHYTESSKSRFVEFKKDPLGHFTDEQIAELHTTFPLMPGTREELAYLRNTGNLTKKQAGDLNLLFIDNYMRGAATGGMMFQLNR